MIYTTLWFRMVIFLYLFVFGAMPFFEHRQPDIPAAAEQRQFNDNGRVSSGDSTSTCPNGAFSPQLVYTDAPKLVADWNPVVLIANGRPLNSWLLGPAYRDRSAIPVCRAIALT